MLWKLVVQKEPSIFNLNRFERIYKEIYSAGLEKRIIYVNKETGVNFLYVQNAAAADDATAGCRRKADHQPKALTLTGPFFHFEPAKREENSMKSIGLMKAMLLCRE